MELMKPKKSIFLFKLFFQVMPYSYISKFIKKLTFIIDWFFLESCDCSLTEGLIKNCLKIWMFETLEMRIVYSIYK